MKIALEKVKKYLVRRLHALEPHYRHFAFYSIGVIVLVSLVMGISLNKGADFSINVEYREPANIFTIMDQVSGWDKDFCKAVYKNYWKEKYPLSKEDQNYLARYKKLREKYFLNHGRTIKDVTKAQADLFEKSEALTEDPLGAIFYSSKTLNETFSKLSTLLTTEEIEFLQQFYQHFKKRYAPILEESKNLAKFAKALSAPMKDQKLVSYLQKVAQFYQSKLGEQYTALYVWAPLGKESYAFPSGDFLIIQCHPDTPAKRIPGPDVIVHEVIHTISARQPLEQKQALTKAFIEVFKDASKVERLKILEEPLAVVWGQALYLKNFNPKLFYQEHYLMCWYNHPWVNVYAQILMPLMEDAYQSGEVMDTNLTRLMAEMAQKLYSATGGYQKSS